jgi:hypothetical protein
MVAKCANPSCTRPFRYFRDGKLFLIEATTFKRLQDSDFRENPQRLEYFWLCEQCVPTMTITLDRSGNPLVTLANKGFQCISNR